MVLRSIDDGGASETHKEFQHQDSPVITRWLGITTVLPGDLRKRDSTEDDRVKAGLSEQSESPALRANGSPHSKNIVTIQASIESEDRAGDVIRADGWELDNYRLNPVVLWAHRHDLLPVGKSVDVWVENDALLATIEFAPMEFAQQVGRMFEEGFLRGVSVGFRALETSPRSGNGRRGTIFERQELLEISAAPVPMHPFALAGGRGGSATVPIGLSAIASQERELVPLFKELAEIWQLVAGVSPPG